MLLVSILTRKGISIKNTAASTQTPSPHQIPPLDAPCLLYLSLVFVNFSRGPELCADAHCAFMYHEYIINVLN